MKSVFKDGSFMLAWQKARAWYNADGTLKDCEYKRSRKGLPTVQAIPARDIHVRAWLTRQGAFEVTTAMHAHDVERAKLDFKMRFPA
jgi:hypothetical protein